MRRILLLSWLLAVAWLLLAADRVEAQEAEALVSSNPPYPLLIDGKEAQRLPASAPLGVQVCVAKKMDYPSEVERYVFKGWRDGPDTECITVTEAREYQAIYASEVLLQVRSKLRPYARSLWVPRGSLNRLEVPEVVEQEPGSRSRFEEWTGGEAPFSPENIVAVVRPMVLEVKWTREYFLTLQGPEGVPLVGGGWKRENQPIVLRAPEVYPQGDKTRLRFVAWEGVSNPAFMIPDAQARLTSFAIDSPHVVSARYQKEYLVVVQTPLGTLKKTWVPEGGEFVVEVPPLIEGGTEHERYRFSGFAGADLKTPRASLAVDGPMVLTALYERQFMVKVSVPYGAKGDGWYAEGATATIEVPPDLGGVLFLRKVFNGFAGYFATGPTLDVKVTGPLIITASYQTQADLEGLAVLVGVLLVGGLIYVFTQTVQRPRSNGGGKESNSASQTYAHRVSGERQGGHRHSRKAPISQHSPRGRESVAASDIGDHRVEGLGEVEAGQVKEAAEAEGIAWRTVQRARSMLPIRVVKATRADGSWAWQVVGIAAPKEN